MFSVTNTGINFFPLCTARVCPTKSGEMVERPISYGDAATNAEAQAMKRAFRKFGLGLFLTLKDTDDNMLDREKAEKWHAWYANQLRGKNGGANPAGGA